MRTDDDAAYQVARQAARSTARVIGRGGHQDLLSTQAIAATTANLAPLAVAALAPMAIVAAPAAAVVGLIALLIGGTAATRKTER